MAFGFFKSPLWELVEQADWVSKYVVLLSLFILSISCIAIIIFKFIALKQNRHELALFRAKLARAHSIHECISLSKEFSQTLGGSLLAVTVEELKSLLEEKKLHASNPVALTQQDYDSLEIVMGQKIEALMMQEECYMPVLSTAAAVGPLAGLFGTIWGLIHAFVKISQEKSADIATVAPGIAEALVTTLAGLVVAIPALIAYNYFANEIRKIEGNLLGASDQLLLLIKKSQLS